MTEHGESVGQEVQQQAPVASAVERQAPAPVEKVFSQSEVNEIVKKAKLDAIRTATERPDYAREKIGDHPNLSQSNSHSQDDIRRIAAEEAQRLRDDYLQKAKQDAEKAEATQIVDEFFRKLDTGKEKYDDYENVVGDIDYGRFPNTVHLITKYIDNTSDVMYELGKDRTKMAMLEQLSNMSPQDALKQVQKLSQSIKENEQARSLRTPKEPLSRLKPSISGADSGVLSVKDLRSKYKA